MSEPTLFDCAPVVKEVTYKEVPNLPFYRLGTDGSIWTKRYRNGKPSSEWHIMHPGEDKDGYLKVILCHGNGIRRHVRLHNLMLEVYVGPCPTGMVGAHENGNKKDCRPCNLAWKTQKDNIADKRRHGTWQQGEAIGSSILTAEQVREIRRRWAAGGVTQRQIAKDFGIAHCTANAIIKGRLWKYLLEEDAA